MRHAGRFTGSVAPIVLLTWSLAGCGPSGDSDPAPAANAGAAGELTGPAASVYVFLEGARSGDDAKVASMLTAVARKELAEKGLSVAPPRSDTARFVVGEVRAAGPEIAHVASRWTDLNPQSGQTQASDMTWVLRKEDGQWRVGGMAMTVFEGEPPLLLDFENPEDMLRQRAMLKAEIARRRQAASVPAAPNEPQPLQR
ncbi:MAG: hypothetical protein JW809_08305 [Pirellulales bacterium]|nr:hypothetical protein [Pirellulales bacterium]